MGYDMTLQPHGVRHYVRELLLDQSTISFCSGRSGRTIEWFIVYNITTFRLGLYAHSHTVANNLLAKLLSKVKDMKMPDMIQMKYPSHFVFKVQNLFKELNIDIQPILSGVRMSTSR